APVANFAPTTIASDNCTSPANLLVTQDPPAGTSVGLGPTSVTISVADEAGHISTCAATFTVTDTPWPTITSISPTTGDAGTTASGIGVTGSNFEAGTTVTLVRLGQSSITASNVVVVDSSNITCDFDLSGAVGGAWNVVVTNPDTQNDVLVNGFVVSV